MKLKNIFFTCLNPSMLLRISEKITYFYIHLKQVWILSSSFYPLFILCVKFVHQKPDFIALFLLFRNKIYFFWSKAKVLRQYYHKNGVESRMSTLDKDISSIWQYLKTTRSTYDISNQQYVIWSTMWYTHWMLPPPPSTIRGPVYQERGKRILLCRSSSVINVKHCNC